MSDDRDDLIWSSQWLRDAPPELLHELTTLSRRRHLQDGELLYARGDAPEGLYGVIRGLIRIELIGSDGRELLAALYAPGDWFGEMSLFDERPRAVHARAVGDTEILLLPARQFRALLERQPQWYRPFARVLSEKLRLAIANIEDNLLLPLSQRLAKRLLDLARVYGQATPEGTLIALRLPQEDLGRMLGATRQSINRELKAMQSAGLVALRQGRVVIVDKAALSAGVSP
ncbi:MAG TPA: Crp/Fnr family transcriptional regulator [Stenotrophobium sp.]|jgi:CRP-like cAMP-binding protein|nr:Crp/Fnr family transcriptional regulator [Stenotrophobium sp.]